MRLMALTTMLGLLLWSPISAEAGSNLDCLATSRGKVLRWNALWSADRADNNVDYRVVNITDINKIPLREVTLELKALGNATASVRKLSVSVEDRARTVCERLYVETKPLRSMASSGSNVRLNELPFIRYTSAGWLRDDFDASVEPVLCQFGNLKFSCPREDKERFGILLKTQEEDLKAMNER